MERALADNEDLVREIVKIGTIVDLSVKTINTNLTYIKDVILAHTEEDNRRFEGIAKHIDDKFETSWKHRAATVSMAIAGCAAIVTIIEMIRNWK